MRYDVGSPTVYTARNVLFQGASHRIRQASASPRVSTPTATTTSSSVPVDQQANQAAMGYHDGPMPSAPPSTVPGSEEWLNSGTSETPTFGHDDFPSPSARSPAAQASSSSGTPMNHPVNPMNLQPGIFVATASGQVYTNPQSASSASSSASYSTSSSSSRPNPQEPSRDAGGVNEQMRNDLSYAARVPYDELQRVQSLRQTNLAAVDQIGTNTLCGFGFYKTWTYETVFNTDSSYCDWVVKHMPGSKSVHLKAFGNWILRKRRIL